jgi:nucleoside-diphosphate-sugar epimerase
MRILIIGGTGFIGSFLVPVLVAQGHVVAIFHRGQTQQVESDPSVIQLLGDRKHLAAHRAAFQQFDPQVVIDMVAYTEQDGIDLINAFRGLAQRVVVLSSMDVYRSYGRLIRLEGGAPDPVPAREDSPLRQVLYPYRRLAKSDGDLLYYYEKILVELSVTACSDLPATLLRLPAVYGPKDPHHRLFEYQKRMDDKRPAILLDKMKAGWRWSRGYVENVATAIALAATDPRALGRVYNIGDPIALTETDWVRRIGQVAGWKGQIVSVPEPLLPASSRMPYDWRHDCIGDTGLIRRELGYKESVSIDEGLQRTIAWERANPPEVSDPNQFDYAAEDDALAKVKSCEDS